MKCSLCPRPARPKQSYCSACHASKMREWRKTHPLKGEARVKMNARSYLHIYIRRGKFKKLPCETCHNPKSEAHHPDYSKPLVVRWLCRTCHLALHREPI